MKAFTSYTSVVIFIVLMIFPLSIKSNQSPRTASASCGRECSTTIAENPVKIASSVAREFGSVLWNSRTHLLSGAIARGVSIFVLYPLDTLKTRLQLSKISRSSLVPLSFPVLFKGVFGSLCGQIPYGMLTFGTYEVLKIHLSSGLPRIPQEGIYFISAIVGDLIGSVWLCPSEVVKQQVQSGIHSSVMSAVCGIYANEGVAGFFKGYAGQLMRDVPFRAIQLPCYEMFKAFYTRKFATPAQGDDDTKPTPRLLRPEENLLVGIIAGSVAASLTTPLDVLKTRLMTTSLKVASRGAAPNAFATAISTVVQIGRTEGARGLFAGLGPRVLYVGPSVGLFFVVYEATKQLLATKAA